MSAIDHLRAIARGDTPTDDGLLGNARCGWGRGELIGEESILAAFCAHPFNADGDVLAVEAGQGAALIGGQDALFADVYDGRIGRLWRVGAGVIFPDEPAIDVAFDPDMRQLRGDVYLRAEDHPALDGAGAEPLLAAARMHVDQVRRKGALRVRAFVLRAFGGADRGAALLSVFAMTNGTNRSASFSYAILGFGSDEAAQRAVGEQTPPRTWTPRF
jgi:hypothetical protein